MANHLNGGNSSSPLAPASSRADVSQPRSTKILGSSVHLVDTNYVVGQMEEWIRQGRTVPKQIVVSGFHGLWMAYKEPSLKAILRTADLWVPDGIAPVWAARLHGHRGISRVPGAELMEAFFAAAEQQRYRSFFYGDTPETLQELTTRVAVRYPRHKSVGTFSPPFRPLRREEDERVIRRINDSGADVLWVGLGLPKQERWIFEHRYRLHVSVAVGVGAAFGFISQRIRRCPRWVGGSGFEWAYRFLMEPKRLWRRDLLEGTQFLTHLALELSGLRKYD